MNKQVKRYGNDFKNHIISLNQNGSTYKQLQEKFGISSSSITNWKHQHSKTKQELKLLHKRVLQLEEECLILNHCSFQAPLKEKLETIYKLRNEFRIKTLSRVLKVNRSSFYAHFFRPESKRA